MVRRIDPRSRPLRLRDGSWTILGCWLPEPESPPPDAAPAACCSLLQVTRDLKRLHRQGLAHGLLTVLTTRFSPPAFGGLRCLVGTSDLDALREDDRNQLTALTAGVVREWPNIGAHCAVEGWSLAVGAGHQDPAADLLNAPHRHHDPPAYVDFGRSHGGDDVAFRDVLLAVLHTRDALLRQVTGDNSSAPPLDFVVCVGGVLAVLEHRTRLRGVTLDGGSVVEIEAGTADGSPPHQRDAERRRS